MNIPKKKKKKTRSAFFFFFVIFSVIEFSPLMYVDISPMKSNWYTHMDCLMWASPKISYLINMGVFLLENFTFMWGNWGKLMHINFPESVLHSLDVSELWFNFCWQISF